LTANPFLALGALIAVGLVGIVRALDPGEPVLSNPALLSEHEREAKGIARLPESLPEALDALDKDSVLLKAMGPALVESYLAVKRSEADFYQGKSPEDIAAWHRLRY
jgi:glutamine synthetase